MITLETDQPCLTQQEYKVVQGGTYNENDLVPCYKDGDEVKGIYAFLAQFIATGINL